MTRTAALEFRPKNPKLVGFPVDMERIGSLQTYAQQIADRTGCTVICVDQDTIPMTRFGAIRKHRWLLRVVGDGWSEWGIATHIPGTCYGEPPFEPGEFMPPAWQPGNGPDRLPRAAA